jgi:outer membrane protein with beta-barrel domain
MFRTSSVVRSLTSTLALLALAGAGAAHAQDEENPSGPYISAGFGQFDVKIDNLDAAGDTLRDLDSDDAAWKIGFGWRFAPFFALEADYVDLGTPNGNFDATGSSGQYEVDLAGFSTYAIGTLPLGIFELSAKIGYYFHDIDVHVDFDNIGPGNGEVFDSDESGEAFVYGVGAGVTFIQHLNVQIEYELMDIDEVDDSYVLWLTGAWRF